MALTWKPAIYKSSTLTELPRPILSLRPTISWDFETSKVPLADGQTTDGHSRNGIDISITGVFGKQADSGDLLTEEDMFGEYESWVSLLDISADSDKYEFFFYHETSPASYRKVKDCVTKGFTADIGDDDHKVFPYEMQIFAEDPVIYQTAPGA